jgi:hypothetical protein
MVDLISQTVITPTLAANDLQSHGLDAFGLTVPNLSPVWANSTPASGDYDSNALTLRLTDARAPFRAVREYVETPTLYSGVDGKPVPGPVAVMRLHPEASRRLLKLVENRLGASPAIHPVPVALVARGVTMPSTAKVPEWFFAGDAVDFTGAVTISFHDDRGLIVDPIAVASLFRELLSFRPGLNVGSGTTTHTVNDAGGLTGIAGLASGTLIHTIDPHGWGYVPTRDKARLKVLDASNNAVSTVPDGGLATLAANQGLGRTSADDTADGVDKPLRWGFATNGTLARTRLVPPTLPSGVTLGRQFFRVMAVDLDWHLVGNRTADPVADIPGDDDTVPDFLVPIVRDPVPGFAYLTDAQDVSGSAAAMTAGFGGQATTVAVAVSPVLDEGLRVPPQPGVPGHWPAFPSFASPQPISSSTNPRQGATAARRAAADGTGADRDVILTVAAGTVPDGAHLRAFPRLFQKIQAIGNTPSFIRPDGGAAIAQPGVATKVLLVNPFGLQPADPFPNPASLAVDMVVTDRTGKRRLFSQTTITVDAGPESFVDNAASFSGDLLLGAAGLKAALDSGAARGVAKAALFGLPRTTPLPPISDTAAFVRAMASETQPREGPRLPTMMRFDSLLVTGTAAATGNPVTWTAVTSGVRFTREARAARADLGNPGNPAGPDVIATGIRASGQLARDLGVHAIKRAQPIVPLGGGTKGWVIETGKDTWNTPPPDTTGTVAAVMLETVAAICDTPELSLFPDPLIGDDPQTIVNRVTSAFGTTSVPVAASSAVELVRRVQREVITAKHGQRDALWSLTRVFSQAREFIYVESPAFAPTARPASVPIGHEIDLVQLLGDVLGDNPRLKVVVCTPRVPDFATDKQGWVRTAFRHRKEAISFLASKAKLRLAAFHPIGFPGRSSPLRTTTIIVDDVWCLVGTSHFRRRGMTFDGAVDIASIDRQIAKGYSSAIAKFRQSLMAQRLGVDVPTSPTNTSPLWVRLAQPESAFSAVAALLNEGGEGRLTAIWAGPDDNSVLPQTDDVADPDGANGATFQTFIAGALSGE